MCSTIQTAASATCAPDRIVGEPIADNVQRTQTIIFADNGMYTIDVVEDGTRTIAYLQRCLTERNLTCAQFEAEIDCGKAGQLCGTAGFSASCSPNTSGNCECIEKYTNYQGTEEGTYTLSGNSLTMVSTGYNTTPESSSYCITGNTLTLRATSPTYTGSVIITYTRQ